MSVAFDSDVTLTVEAAFGYAFDDTWVWTDISAYARQVSIRRGRSHERDSPQAGSCQIVLSNDDGRFDPSYTTGAYYPNVKIGVPVRVRAAYSAVTYDLFLGFVDEWPQAWPAMKDATTTVSATDGFKILANEQTSTVESAEKTGARIGNLLDDAGWPAGLRSLDTGQVTCPSYGRDNANVLELVRQVVAAEGGSLFADGAGNVVFHDRYHRSQATTEETFGDSGSELRYSDLKLGFDDTQLFNRVEVVRTGQSDTQWKQGTGSIGDYGRRVLRFNDVLVATDAESLGLAELYRDIYKLPALRVASLTVTPRRDPAGLWPAALGLEIDDEVVVNRRPPAGNTITETLYVEGVTHRFSAGKDWQTTFTFSHFTPGDGPFLELGHSTDGKLNTGKLGY